MALSVAVFGACAALAQNNDTGSQAIAPAAQDRTLLSWEIQDVRDAMTDKLTRLAVSHADFSNGTSVEASAKCDEIGIEFAFGTFSNKDPLPLSANGKEIQLRVRTDNGDTRVVRADRQYTNQAKTLFYHPDTSRAVLARSVRAPGGDSPMEKALIRLCPVHDQLTNWNPLKLSATRWNERSKKSQRGRRQKRPRKITAAGS